MTEEEVRKEFNIPDDEEVPDFVKYLPLTTLPLSAKDLAWAKKVARRVERSRTVDEDKTLVLTGKEIFALQELVDYMSLSYGEEASRSQATENMDMNEEELNVLYGKLLGS